MNFEEFVDQMMEETKNGLEERGRIGISVTLVLGFGRNMAG